MLGQLGKSHRGIDVITQQLFSEPHFAGEKAFQGIAKKPSSKGEIAFHIRLNRFPKISRQSHFLFPFFLLFLSPPVVFPSVVGKPDVVLLTLFRSTAK